MVTKTRPPRKAVDGVLLLDKPKGMSSNGALQSARRLLNAKKAGHTGTLDPMATGLMVLTFGEATKFSQMLLDADKAYEALVKLGVETDTGDAEGVVLATREVTVSAEAVRAAAAGFVGEIEQIPPMYSALKRDGKPLYEYARAGVEVERSARRVSIRSLQVSDVASDTFVMRVECSKGTYIRTLAIDIGRVLGCGAHLAGLRRTGIGPFDLADALTLESLEAMPEAERMQQLQAVDALLTHLPVLSLDATQAGAILHGQAVQVAEGEGQVRVYGPAGFIGLAEYLAGRGVVPRRLVNTAENA
ncbi:tRNA pseudouridine(55) synthase TruB [Azoarcus taiwanensis]|uniref:tRNA pseudouridine synthase B n=1 Tax=Azoarcus taiwanensis TaxID=666964 RepID=A0A972F6L3_9RHOO|nr:tRNA pseudouridine(55) synthase TruB [Azoarcus taiwanensis]